MLFWPSVDGTAYTKKAWAKFLMCNFFLLDIEEPPQIF